MIQLLMSTWNHLQKSMSSTRSYGILQNDTQQNSKKTMNETSY